MDYKSIQQPEIIPWIKSWTNPKNQFRVLMIHYTADPNKDPNRDGLEWYTAEKKWMPKEKWNKEYEIDFSSKSGQLVFGSEYCDFDPAIHFIDSKQIDWELLFSLDFGQSNPNAWYIAKYDNTGTLYIVDEYYKPAIPSVASKEMFYKFAHHFGTTEDKIKELSIDRRRDLFRNTFQIAVIDPTTRAKNRTKISQWEEVPFSVLEDFYDNWMEFDLWNNDWEAWITRIREYFQLNNGKAHLYIFKDKCPNLCEEITKYKYKEQTETQARSNNKPDKPTKKRDHAIDSLRYLIMTRPSKPTEVIKELTIIQKDIQRLLRPKNIMAEWDVD